MGSESGEWARGLGSRLLDSIFPPRCEGCSGPLQNGGSIPVCDRCDGETARIGTTVCRCCGYPYAGEGTVSGVEEPLCGRCMRDPPPYRWHRSGLFYADLAGELIAAFKYRRRRDMAARLAAWAWWGWECPVGVDCLVPVPLAADRLRQRGFNQALLLAQWLARRWEIPVATKGVVRLPGPSQVGLSRRARYSNSQGRFTVTDPGRFQGRGLLVVDDVYTTGATLRSFSNVLGRAGAESVQAVTLARRM